MDVTIERMEPERSGEPTTLVVETGFDQIPLARRARAFRDNEGGWASQMRAIADHLGRSS